MDTNEKAPVQKEKDGNKKPYRGKRRPHHKHGDHKPDNNAKSKDAVSATPVAEASESSAAPRMTPPTNKRQGNKNTGNKNEPGRKQNKPQKADTAAASSAQDTAKAEAKEQTNAPAAPQRSQRPQRPQNTNTPKKNTALPQMDNLLIEDCPEEVADISGYTTEAAEIERILNHDLFAKTSHEIPAEIPEGKVVIVGVRFRAGGKTYFFDPGQISCVAGNYAIVETARGLEFGEICIGNRMVESSLVVPPLRPVIRLATPEDLEQNKANHAREDEAFRVGKEKIAEHGLDMKLVSVQYTFDNSKLLFYFTSDGRVDFRELVKDLAGVFHIRIELRQIGIRDEARMLGGLGACGRPLCCNSFLSDFGQVSMKMAKEQNLSLNSTKISGCCGRLMCCLRYEHETYAEALRQLPNLGAFVNTPDGPGVVTDVLPLEEAVKVSLRADSGTAPKKYSKQDITLQHRNHTPEEVPAEITAEPDSDD